MSGSSKWLKKTLPLKPGHGWECREGYSIFVADRGAVRFDVPSGWVIEPGKKGSVKVMDATPPDDECTLEMSIYYLSDDVDWSGLPVSTLVVGVTEKEDEDEQRLGLGDLVTFERDGMQVAWRETRFLEDGQEARSRTLIARWSNIQPLFTFAYWKKDEERLKEPWDEFLRTLRLGDYVEDPTQRVVD